MCYQYIYYFDTISMDNSCSLVNSNNIMTTTCILLFQNDSNGLKKEATIDDIIKIVEDLTRIH